LVCGLKTRPKKKNAQRYRLHRPSSVCCSVHVTGVLACVCVFVCVFPSVCMCVLYVYSGVYLCRYVALSLQNNVMPVSVRGLLQCIASCCSALQCVAMCNVCVCSRVVAVYCIVLQCIAVCCNVLQCVALCVWLSYCQFCCLSCVYAYLSTCLSV